MMEAETQALRSVLKERGSVPPQPAPDGETITQAAEAWFSEMQRPGAGVRPQTLDGHRLRVRAFVEHCGDIPLASVTRAMASDFLTAITAGRSNRTVNNYAMTMQCLFKSARNRGRFQGENPFEDQRHKAGGEKREAFTAAELHKLFAALPLDLAPAKHAPESALPWAVRIAAYTGMRLEEIAQLTVADVQTRGSNGGTVVVFDVHNGDAAHHLKNDSSARAIPVHSELVRARLLEYIRALPQDGLLFPGLKRRASKGGKIGARLGELFAKKLKALGMKRDGLCFHSLRHTVAQRLEAAAVSQTDAARVTGHAIEGMTYGVYSSGPGLKRLAAVVEAIEYEGLRLPRPR
jgi:integrase